MPGTFGLRQRNFRKKRHSCEIPAMPFSFVLRRLFCLIYRKFRSVTQKSPETANSPRLSGTVNLPAKKSRPERHL